MKTISVEEAPEQKSYICFLPVCVKQRVVKLLH